MGPDSGMDGEGCVVSAAGVQAALLADVGGPPVSFGLRHAPPRADEYGFDFTPLHEAMNCRLGLSETAWENRQN